ncbi:MAG TPA: Uma2 family endonuclease [Candidatus Binatia bacterium]|jgi:Uma2 family endonuclease|nr:Uma2 family endonuclease [Candidatus Binatia bacterium]
MTALTDPVAPDRWTVDAFLRLVTDGVLGPDDRVELLEGVIVSMAPQDVPHATGMALVSRALFGVVGRDAHVRIQLPFRAGGHSLPEPDAAVVAGSPNDYHDHPSAALLVVEVADTSLKHDRLTKRAIYAAANVPEYWIVNIPDDCVEVRRDPDPGGRRYASVTIARRGDTLALLELPGVRISVGDLLPTRAH